MKPLPLLAALSCLPLATSGQECPVFISFVQIRSETGNQRSHYLHANGLGTLVHSGYSDHHPLPGQGLPNAVYADMTQAFGWPQNQQFLACFPLASFETASIGPYQGVGGEVFPLKVNSDSRSPFSVTVASPFRQGQGAWAVEVIRPNGPLVSSSGCALATVAMAGGYSARTVPDLDSIKTLGLIDQTSGDITDWPGLFAWLRDHGGVADRELIEAKQLMTNGASATNLNGYPATAEDFAKFTDLEKILKERNAMAIIRVPPIGKPNDLNKSHFVLCSGIEDDMIDGLPMKRLKIHDPARQNFVDAPTIPIRYLDQHSDNRLRAEDHAGSPLYQVRYFVVPAAPAAAPRVPRNGNVTGDLLTWTAPGGVTLFPMLNGTLIDYLGLTLANKLDSVSNSTEELDNPNSIPSQGSTTSLLQPQAGTYTFTAIDFAPSGIDRRFAVSVARTGRTAAPLNFQGTISGTSGLGTLSLTLSAPVASGLEAWAESFDIMGATATADPDHDGTVMLLEYAFGMVPNAPDSIPTSWDGSSWFPGLPTGQITTVSPAGTRRLVIGFARRTAPDLSYFPEFATSLAPASWAPGELLDTVSINATWEFVRYGSPLTPPSSSRWFGRVRVTEN